MAFIQLNYPSGALQQNTDVSIILPDPPGSAHVSPGRAYQTLYLLHGTYGDHSDWWRKTALERYAQEACLAVVMPSCGNAFYQDMVHGPKYKTFLLEELPAYLRSILPLSPRREDNFIAGLSMGGYGAMHLALSKPGQYAAAASLSGVMSFSMVLSSTRFSAISEMNESGWNTRRASFSISGMRCTLSFETTVCTPITMWS